MKSTNPVGSFTFVLHSHIPYVMDHGRTPHGMDWLSEGAADTYIPLLQICHRLIAEGISPKFVIGITPILAEQLAHPEFTQELLSWFGFRFRSAKQNRLEFLKEGRIREASLAEFWISTYSARLQFFLNECNQDLVGAFKLLQDDGHIEVITSAATHGYLPLIGSDTCVRAQIQVGVDSYRRHFGCEPTGFWLPECAYRPDYPWARPTGGEEFPRRGVDDMLTEQGIRYFFVDSAIVTGGKSAGVYAERFPLLAELQVRERGSRKSHASVASPNYMQLVNTSKDPDRIAGVFSRNMHTGQQVWSSSVGYPGAGCYLEFHKKHKIGGLRYWRVTSDSVNLGEKSLYEPLEAFNIVQEHAAHFAELVAAEVKEAASTGDFPNITSMYDTELYGHWWFEGPEWLYYARKALEQYPEVDVKTAREVYETAPGGDIIRLAEGSWGSGNYHYTWLNPDTLWVWDRIYKCEDRFMKCAYEQRDNERARPLLKQMARELVLLESSDWPFLISTGAARDYAEIRVEWHESRFNILEALVQKLAAGIEPSTEEWGSLGEAEARDLVFENIDPEWWVL